MMMGANLQGGKTSHITHAMIRGAHYVLEDGKTFLSQEEAIEWAMVNRFSPLHNGFRLNTF